MDASATLWYICFIPHHFASYSLRCSVFASTIETILYIFLYPVGTLPVGLVRIVVFPARLAIIYCASPKKKKNARINFHLMIYLGLFRDRMVHDVSENIEQGVGCGWEYLRGL